MPGDPERVGEFWLAGRLGAGGQGVVYEAYGPDGARVAVKVLHSASDSPQDLEQMGTEARAAQRVASFCTARIVQVRLKPPRPYIVSEYIDGVSLQAAVTGAGDRQPRRFGGDELHRLGIGIATALTAIHQARVVHRDLKPGNVMLGPDGPRLIDFGIARVVETHSAPQGGGLVGTLRYMAPEVYAGKRAGAEADVFAWGAIMVFAATGRHAFTGSDLPQIAHQVRSHEPDLSALPEPLRALVAAALDKDPLRRPSARAILAALTGDPNQDTGEPQNLVRWAAGRAAPHSGWQPGDPALGKLAEDIYSDLPSEEQRLVPEVFLRCVVPGEETGEWSIRPVPARELFDRPEPAALERVVRAFAPLLTITGDHTPDPAGPQPSPRPAERVLLTRPALPRAWPRLHDWLDSHRQDLAAHHRLRQAAHTWDSNGRRRGDVLTGINLDQAMRWAGTGHPPFPNRAERGLLDASTRTQTARTRRTRIAALLLAVATLLSLTATGWAVQAQHTATRQRDTATRQRDTVVSDQLLTRAKQATDPTVSALLAVASRRFRQTPENRAGLLDILAKPERAVLKSHTGDVDSVAFSPDGTTLATGSGDKTARLWNARTHQSISLTGHTAPVESVAFSPDGTTLATGSGDKSVRLWNVKTHKPIGTPLTGHTDSVESVAFSPDGTTLATGSSDGTARLWNVNIRQPTSAPLTGHTGIVDSVAFNHDGTTLATGSGDKTVRLWNVNTHKPVGTPLTGHTSDVLSVAFSPDGTTLATGSSDKTARLWNVNTHKPTGKPLTGHTSIVDSVAFNHDGTTLATGSYDKTVRLWNVKTHKPIGTPLTGHTDSVESVAFSPDGTTLATGSSDGTMRLWNVHTHQPTGKPLTGHDVGSVAFSPDGRTLATVGSTDDTVWLWDARTREPIGELFTDDQDTEQVVSVAFSPDGRTLATGGYFATVRLWNVSSRQPIGEPITHSGGVYSLAFSPDGTTLATGSIGMDDKLNPGRADRESLRLWNVRDHRQVGKSITSYNVYSLAFSPDGHTIATGSYDKTVRLWNVRDHKPTSKPLTGYPSIVDSLAFSPDGHTVATAGGNEEKNVWLWDVRNQQPIGAPLTGHTDFVESVAFSPDGTTLATGSSDKTMRLWDVRTHQPIGAPLTGHTGSVESVAFSPDGHTIATGNPDGIGWLWDVAMPEDKELAGFACEMAARTLTHQEWTQYTPPEVKFRKVCT
ncbi:protein kinase domain-containing protein [Actinomadura xylanilytica]|uniref:protein kinase domain-containing protein n=1 Tax=Actinomadura xylanilytica TaxID=887459 RepID=UPI00255B1DE7|nr:protein kinase [Actinomadura xylanilytica]MDL4775224.1 protein kinase [Actinomadura xylanilytica]